MHHLLVCLHISWRALGSAAIVSHVVMAEVVLVVTQPDHQSSSDDHWRKAHEGLLSLILVYRKVDFITPHTHNQKPHTGVSEISSMNPFVSACHTEDQLSSSLQGHWSWWVEAAGDSPKCTCALSLQACFSGTKPVASFSRLLQSFPPPLPALYFLPLELGLKTCASFYVQNQTCNYLVTCSCQEREWRKHNDRHTSTHKWCIHLYLCLISEFRVHCNMDMKRGSKSTSIIFLILKVIQTPLISAVGANGIWDGMYRSAI